MSPRTGRPKIENPKRNQIKIRTTDDESNMIEFCAKAMGISKTEVILLGVKKVYDELVKK